MRLIFITAAAVACATPVLAQEHPAPTCPATPTPLPAELSGWTQRSAVAAASQPSMLSKAQLQIGKAADLTLIPTGKVGYVTAPEKAGAPHSFGGIAEFTVTTAGTYRVALGSGVWVDVLKGQTAIASTAHGHGPACSGVRKMVDFALTPGRHVLQVAGSTDARVAAMIVRRK